MYIINSQTIFSFGGNFSKLPTVLGAWVRQCAIIRCFRQCSVQNKVLLHAYTSAAKITRHLADMVNYPLRIIKQLRTRIKFEYISIIDINFRFNYR